MGNIIFKGYMPTNIDVAKLEQTFGVPAEGQLITYEELEAILALGRRDNRFKSVLGAWRKKLDRENNIMLKAVPNQGLECQDPRGRVSVCAGQYKSALRGMAKSSLTAARTRRNGLDPENCRILDHIQNTGASLRLAAATAARQINYDFGDELVSEAPPAAV